MTWRGRVQRDDAGVTLPELLMAMAITTFIVGALAFSLVIAVRNTAATRDRVGTSAQTLTAFFPGDVMGIRTVGGASVAPADTTGCAGDPGGANVLRLTAARPDGDPTVVLVSYQVLPDGDAFRLVRVSCTDGAVTVSTVVQNIADAGTVSAEVVPTADTTDDPDTVGLVRLSAQVGTIDPATISVVGSPRLPVGGTPCSIVSAIPHQLVVSGSPGPLVRDVTFRLMVSDACDGTLELAMPTVGGPLVRALTYDADSDTWSLVARGSDGNWPTGAQTVDVLLNGTEVTDFEVVVVTRPCAVARATPTNATYDSSGALSGALTLQVTTVGACGPSPLSAVITGGTAPLTVSLTGGPTQWTTTIQPASAVWITPPIPAERPPVFTVGTLRTGAGAEAGTFGIDIAAAPCQLVGNPSRTIDTDATGQTTGNVSVAVTTSGVCGPMTVSVPTGTTTPDTFTAVLAGGPTAWTFTIPRCTLGPPTCATPGPTWADGPHTATLADNGVPLAGTFVLTAREVCSSTATGASPSPVLLAGNRLRVDTTVTVTTRGNCGAITMSVPNAGLNNLPMTGNPVRTRTLLQTEGTWSPGPNTVTFRSGATVIGTLNLNAQASCAVVETIADPPKQIDVRGNNTVGSNQRIRFFTTGTTACGATLYLRFDPPGPAGLQMVPATLVNAGTGEWLSADMDGIGWTRDTTQDVYVHWSNVEPVGPDTLAGTFLVRGS